MAVQLVRVDPAGAFHVTAEGLAALAALGDAPVCPIVACGLYRTGKSSLLNALSASSNDFATGATVSRVTRGIWLSTSPLASDTATVPLLLDTEGLGATDAEGAYVLLSLRLRLRLLLLLLLGHRLLSLPPLPLTNQLISPLRYDTKLFTLAVLLASTLVYNSQGALDEAAISALGLVANLSSSVADPALAQHSPSFVWVLRDFALELVDDDGVELTADEYLDISLADGVAYDAAGEARNATRRAIKALFERRSCVPLVRPAASEADLEDLSTGTLRPAFVDGVAALKAKLVGPSLLRPKTSRDGYACTGTAFGSLTRAYVTALNKSSALSDIGSAFEFAFEEECA